MLLVSFRFNTGANTTVDMFRNLTFCWCALLLPLLLMACRPDQKLPANEVRIRLAAEPDRLNPILARNGYSWQLIEQLFQPLMQFDPESLELKPVLIRSAPERRVIGEGPHRGGLAYTFEIRPEARWDNGEPVLASDYIFTLKCIFNPRLPNFHRAFLDFIKAVETDSLNPKRFTVITDEPYFLSEGVCSNFEVYPEYAYDPDSLLRVFDLQDLADPDQAAELKTDSRLGEFAQQFQATSTDPAKVVGSGPYRLVEWQQGQNLILEQKKDWWGASLADPMLGTFPERLYYSVIPDAQAAISLLRSEKIDVMADVPGRQFTELQQNSTLSEQYQWLNPAQLQYYYVALNRKNSKLEDRRVRRALAHLLPTSTIIDQVMYGLAKPTIGPFPIESAYYNDQLVPVAFQPDTARQLLARAGWKDSNANGLFDKVIDGRLVELELDLDISTGSETGKQVGLLFQESARKAGVGINLRTMEFSQLSDRLRGGTFEMSYSARVSRPGESDPSQTWHTPNEYSGRNNYSGFGNAESDALIDSLRRSLDRDQRHVYYRRLQEMIYEDQPVLFVFVPQGRLAIHRRFVAEASQRRPGFFPERFRLKDQ